MIKRKKIIVEEEERQCDVCGEPASHQCHFCYKDLCSYMGNDCAIKDTRCMGDYPDYYCCTCWSKGTHYREKIAKLEEQIWGLENEWERECKQ